MERNKSFGPAVRDGGARYDHSVGAGEGGYGHNSDLPFSKGPELYPSAPNRQIINGDGMENFRDERFAGSSSATPLGSQSNVGKDAIKTGDDENRSEVSY